jgi:hypothetical protein
MPSLIRLLATLGAVVGLVYGTLYVLANWYQPNPREISVTVPPEKYAKQH